MKTLTFIGITLLSGAIAGTLLGLINQVVVEPFIDKAIGIEMQRHIAAGEIIDLNAQSHYRLWQKGGEIVQVQYLACRSQHYLELFLLTAGIHCPVITVIIKRKHLFWEALCFLYYF